MQLSPDVHRLIPTFLAAADCQSFSAAARQLGMTPAAISKNIRQLEQRLEMVLFARNTHFVMLTEEGMRLRDEIAPLWQALDQVLLNPTTEPVGLLRISVIPGFGRHSLMPLLYEFQQRYPRIRMELSMEARNVNLISERIDVAIGIQASNDSRVVARYLCEMKMLMVASPDYLARYGEPQTPQDLIHHRCLVHRNTGSGRVEPWLNDDAIIDESQAGFITTSPDTLVDAALCGMGIVYLADWYLKQSLSQGKLHIILPSFSPEPRKIWAKYAGGKLSPRVRALVDYLSEQYHPS